MKATFVKCDAMKIRRKNKGTSLKAISFLCASLRKSASRAVSIRTIRMCYTLYIVIVWKIAIKRSKGKYNDICIDIIVLVFFALNTFVYYIRETGSNGGKSVTQKFICTISIEFKKAVKYRSIPWIDAMDIFSHLCARSR